MAPVLLLEEHPSPLDGVITFNSNVQITATCPVRTGRGKAYKKIRTLSVGTKVKALYILKNSAGNLWASIDYGSDIGYICLNKAKPI